MINQLKRILKDNYFKELFEGKTTSEVIDLLCSMTNEQSCIHNHDNNIIVNQKIYPFPKEMCKDDKDHRFIFETEYHHNGICYFNGQKGFVIS